MNPYKVLDVNETAKQDEIKAAYRKLAKKYHPDLNPGNKEAEAKFKEISNAYGLIGAEEDRRKYDLGETEEQLREKQRRAHQQYQQKKEEPFYYYETQNPGSRYSSQFEGFDPSLFEEFFNQQKGRQANRAQNYSMEVDFKTAVLGGEREITLPTGKKLQVKIPPGIESGKKLRLANVEKTDVYIEIKVMDSDLFKRVGNDIEVDLPISIVEASLGAEIKVPTVDGAVMLKIPSGLSTGSRVRLKGKGVPMKEGRGDQYALIKIVMPAKVDSDLEKFMKEWGETHSYNPREVYSK